jgi:hypothetical protein
MTTENRILGHAPLSTIEPTEAGQAFGTRLPIAIGTTAHATSGSHKCLNPSCEI